jgi:GNAT superfamily N-acetyltransferase
MSTGIEIRPVTSKKELKKFILFPYSLYKKTLKNPYWAAPLRIDENLLFNRKKHPFYKHAEVQEFIACKNGSIVGRIAGIIDFLHHQYREKDVAYFGFFETVNSKDVAFALFDAALSWAKGKGMKKIIGPINLSTNHILGTLVNDFKGVPQIQVPYNPEYYPELIDAYGFSKEKDHLAFYAHKDKNLLPEKMQRVVNLVRKNKRITLRTVNMKDYWNDVGSAKDLYNNAFGGNSDFVPWTDDEFKHMAKDLKLAIIPQFTFLAFVDGKPAGISIALHNFNDILVKMNGRLLPFGIFKLIFGKNKLKNFRLAIMGVLPEYRSMGIDALIVLETCERAIAIGYESAELSLILEDNHMLVNMLTKWGIPVYRTYRVYTKTLV